MIKLNNHGRTPERTRMRYITPGSRRTSDCQPLRHQLPNHTPGPWLPGPIPSSFPSHLGRPEGRQAELKDFYELALPGWGLVPEWASLNNRGSTHSQAEQNACEQNTPSVPNLPPPRLLETALLAGEKKKKTTTKTSGLRYILCKTEVRQSIMELPCNHGPGRGRPNQNQLGFLSSSDLSLSSHFVSSAALIPRAGRALHLRSTLE